MESSSYPGGSSNPYAGDPVVQQVAAGLSDEDIRLVLETDLSTSPETWPVEEEMEASFDIDQFVDAGIDTDKGSPLEAYAALQDTLRARSAH